MRVQRVWRKVNLSAVGAAPPLLQVACVKSEQGRLLTDDNLINIFQACYRIGHYQTEKGRDTSGGCTRWQGWEVERGEGIKDGNAEAGLASGLCSNAEEARWAPQKYCCELKLPCRVAGWLRRAADGGVSSRHGGDGAPHLLAAAPAARQPGRHARGGAAPAPPGGE